MVEQRQMDPELLPSQELNDSISTENHWVDDAINNVYQPSINMFEHNNIFKFE